jgi:hypothetical protein
MIRVDTGDPPAMLRPTPSTRPCSQGLHRRPAPSAHAPGSGPIGSRPPSPPPTSQCRTPHRCRRPAQMPAVLGSTPVTRPCFWVDTGVPPKLIGSTPSTCPLCSGRRRRPTQAPWSTQRTHQNDSGRRCRPVRRAPSDTMNPPMPPGLHRRPARHIRNPWSMPSTRPSIGAAESFWDALWLGIGLNMLNKVDGLNMPNPVHSLNVPKKVPRGGQPV